MSGEERGGPGREEARRALEEAVGSGGAAGSDAEELRVVLGAITEFVERLKKPLEELLDKLLTFIEGERVGRDVAGFYRQLRESGLPEDVAVEMTREYFKKRLEAVDVIGLLREILAEEGGGEKEEEEEEEEG